MAYYFIVNFAFEKLGLLILFPKRVIYLLKPTDNQRIEQVLRKLVVLNVVGSNPTSHPEEILGNQRLSRIFRLYTLALTLFTPILLFLHTLKP